MGEVTIEIHRSPQSQKKKLLPTFLVTSTSEIIERAESQMSLNEVQVQKEMSTK